MPAKRGATTISSRSLICDICDRKEVDDIVFDEGEVGLGGEDGLHALGVGGFVALAAGGPDGGPAAQVEGLRLERGKIGITAHFATKGVKLAD